MLAYAPRFEQEYSTHRERGLCGVGMCIYKHISPKSSRITQLKCSGKHKLYIGVIGWIPVEYPSHNEATYQLNSFKHCTIMQECFMITFETYFVELCGILRIIYWLFNIANACWTMDTTILYCWPTWRIVLNCHDSHKVTITFYKWWGLGYCIIHVTGWLLICGLFGMEL